MADNEYAYQQQLINQINSLARENAMLEAELETAVQNIAIVADNIDSMSVGVIRDMITLRDHTTTVDEETTMVQRAMDDLTHRYFTFKNLSTASKNLTQYSDEYYTRFRYFNKLRRITLGYVIGLDNTIIRSETLRKEVEKIYLQNTDYWLAYAIAAVMLWASNEKEAARRAMKKALAMDVCRTDVFFLLINLRFERLDVAKDWYLDYLDKVDLTSLSSEYQYLLEAYLAGLFGADPEFEKYVSDNFQQALDRIDAVTVDFAARFTARAKSYAQTYLHMTDHTFPTLQETSSDYNMLLFLLSRAECNAIFAKRYSELATRQEEYSEDQSQRVENVLYNLINAYDDDEWKVIKKQKYNEAIIEARGDLAAASAKYEAEYANLDKKRSLDQMMLDWAFSDDPTITNLVIKRFTITLMREPISRGFEQFAEQYRSQEPSQVHVAIDGYELQCNEFEYEQSKDQLIQYYTKDKAKHAFADKYVKLFTLVVVASVLILVLTAFAFSPVMLTIGVLGGIVGGFVLWRRLVEVNKQLEERMRLSVTKLGHALEELQTWRKLFHDEDANAAAVKEAFELFV